MRDFPELVRIIRLPCFHNSDLDCGFRDRCTRQDNAATNDVGRSLCYHDDGRIDVAADKVWHHRGIDHPQAFGAEHIQLGVDHSRRVARDAHLACPERVMNGDAGLGVVLGLIGIADAQRRQTLSGERPQRRLGADLLSHPQARAQNLATSLFRLSGD